MTEHFTLMLKISLFERPLERLAGRYQHLHCNLHFSHSRRLPTGAEEPSLPEWPPEQPGKDRRLRTSAPRALGLCTSPAMKILSLVPCFQVLEMKGATLGAAW